MSDNPGNIKLDETGEPHFKDCSNCFSQRCRKGKDCYPDTNAEVVGEYKNDDNLGIILGSAAIEGRYYGTVTRLEEIRLFAEEMGYNRLGIANCIGLIDEARTIAAYLKKYFEVYVISCKNGGVLKSKFGLQQITAENEVMCNPIGQARFLNKYQTDMNIICGLCVGHDMLFTKYSAAPVTTLITKDRVLGHNPAAVLYSSYYRKKVLELDR